MSEWISVKDKLPETYDRVLVYAPSRYDYGSAIQTHIMA